MRAAGLAVVAILAAGPAGAGEINPGAEPAVWLSQIYDLYHRSEKDDALAVSAEDVIGKRASRALTALFKREAECVKKSSEVCALDWDFVVDGQDFELSQVKVGPLQAAGDKATVTVTFKNMNARNANVYYFVREDGDWKVDDIEARSGGEKPVRIAQLLKDFKDY